MSDNLFSGLVHRRTAGIVREFVLWCVVCFAALLSLIAMVVGRGNITWIMLMFFSIGMGVIMAFRLTLVALLYSSGVFCLITVAIHYICFAGVGSYYDDVSYSALNIILFVLILLTAIALVVCEFVHLFTRYNLGTAIIILIITEAFFTLILQILMFAAGYLGSSAYANEWLRESLNARGYWIGTVDFWMVLTVTVLLHIFFFRGLIDRKQGKFINGSGGQGLSSAYGLKGVRGIYAGKVISLRNGGITIGSGSESEIILHDNYVSKQHCIVRFNCNTNYYEVYDSSTNGIYLLSTGGRLQKGAYNSVRRGEIICIGSAAQQFQLL